MEWILPSQLIITDRKKGETPEEILLRHETMRRITAEADLIAILDILELIRKSKDTSKLNVRIISTILKRFL